MLMTLITDPDNDNLQYEKKESKKKANEKF